MGHFKTVIYAHYLAVRDSVLGFCRCMLVHWCSSDV